MRKRYFRIMPSLIICLDGRPYGCGNNNVKQLGLKNPKYTNLTPISSLLNICSVAYNNKISLFLSEGGQAYCCGKYKDILHICDKNNQKIKDGSIQNVPIDDKIISMCLGQNHALFLSQTGTVYSCGFNQHAESGFKDTWVRKYLRPIEIKNCIAIACGDSHSLFLTDQKQVYGCGDNQYGQLAMKEQKSCVTLNKIDLENYVDAIFCGDSCSFFVCHDETYACGSNSLQRLGTGMNKRSIYDPTKIMLHQTLVSIKSNNNYSLFLTNEGDVFVCGGNGEGQLGLGHYNDILIPIKNNLTKVTAINIIGTASLFVVEDCKLFFSGSGRNCNMRSTNCDMYECFALPQEMILPSDHVDSGYTNPLTSWDNDVPNNRTIILDRTKNGSQRFRTTKRADRQP